MSVEIQLGPGFWTRRTRQGIGVLILVVSSCLVGCFDSVGRSDREELQQETVRDAMAKEESGDMAAAIALYREAVESNPRLARAHFNLALRLHERSADAADCAAAVYHYQRYLALQPDTEKRELIEDRIRIVGQSLAAFYGVKADKSMAAFEQLERDNQALKRRIADMEKAVEQTAALQKELEELKAHPAPVPAPVVAPVVAEAPAVVAPAAAKPDPRTYRVGYGDTLSSIAAEMYGDARKWRKIFDANRSNLGSSHTLKVGQILIIPE